jgi:hypothetical protein
VHANSHKVWLYETMFCAGFRLPFTPIIRGRLCHLGLATHQIVPIAWHVFLTCAVLWPMVLGKENPLTVQEFMWMYKVQKNPKVDGVYNFQSRWGKFVQLEVKFSSNKWC